MERFEVFFVFSLGLCNPFSDISANHGRVMAESTSTSLVIHLYVLNSVLGDVFRCATTSKCERSQDAHGPSSSSSVKPSIILTLSLALTFNICFAFRPPKCEN